jgi:hypothetical protein
MRQSMKNIALNALQGDVLRGERRTLRDLLGSLSEGPVAVDVWIEDDLGFVLLMHRRSDGLASEELYYSLRDEAGQWQTCEHLGGAILGFDVEMPTASQHTPVGSRLSVLSESEALIYTGRRGAEDGYETVRARTVLVGDDVDVLEITDLSQHSTAQGRHHTLDVRWPLLLLVLLPGMRLRVAALRRKGEALTATGDVMGFSFPEQ